VIPSSSKQPHDHWGCTFKNYTNIHKKNNNTMAEIHQSNEHRKGQKRMSTKIDMTPMVDLGFLLITFFMLTTTLQKPSVMQLNMPDKNTGKITNPVPASKTLALIPGPANKVYYFRGDPNDKNTIIGTTNYSINGLRKIIIENKKAVEALPNGKDHFVVVVMPMDKASYKNVVDLLDELAINGADRYGIIEPSPAIISKIKDAKGIIL
jgi:biopolymer transport protein ExbD